MQSAEGVLIIDDSIEEKPYTDENDIVCWQYDHSKDRHVKGINFVTALYHNQRVGLPVGFLLIAKIETYTEQKTQKERRRRPGSKNEIARELIEQAVRNQIPFHFVLFDSGFASAEDMMFIKHEQQRDFICPLKTNRKVAVSVAAKLAGHFQRVDTLELEESTTREVYLVGVSFPLRLAQQVFTNEDGSIGILDLVTSDTTLGFDDLTTSYQTRWQVEGYHKSLKHNVSLAKSPTQTETTKSKLYIKALHSGFDTLRELIPIQCVA